MHLSPSLAGAGIWVLAVQQSSREGRPSLLGSTVHLLLAYSGTTGKPKGPLQGHSGTSSEPLEVGLSPTCVETVGTEVHKKGLESKNLPISQVPKPLIPTIRAVSISSLASLMCVYSHKAMNS